jgi:hypothetical protein
MAPETDNRKIRMVSHLVIGIGLGKRLLGSVLRRTSYTDTDFTEIPPTVVYNRSVS